MKTEYKFIHFEDNGKNIWECKNTKSKVVLGGVAYYPKWKQYVFFANPEVNAIFNNNCLSHIQDFISQLNNTRNSN